MTDEEKIKKFKLKKCLNCETDTNPNDEKDTLEKVLALPLFWTKRREMIYMQNGKPTHISGKTETLRKTQQNS